MCAVLIENCLTNVINVYFSYALPGLFRHCWNPTFSTECVSYVADFSVMYLSHFWKYTECLKLVVPISVCVCVCVCDCNVTSIRVPFWITNWIEFLKLFEQICNFLVSSRSLSQRQSNVILHIMHASYDRAELSGVTSVSTVRLAQVLKHFPTQPICGGIKASGPSSAPLNRPYTRIGV